MRVIPSWLRAEGVDEIVLIDWSSEPPISSLALPADPRLRLVRAATERGWSLARAYNLALQLSTADIVLKVDSDTWLDPQVLRIQSLLEKRLDCKKARDFATADDLQAELREVYGVEADDRKRIWFLANKRD